LSPYQKPAKLFSYLIEHHSLHGDWVLDATGGSGNGFFSKTPLPTKVPAKQQKI
jgi:hypothetical protein